MTVDGQMLPGLQYQHQFTSQHRFGLLLILNPLYPTFEYSLYLASQIQLTFPMVFVTVCVKGANQENHLKVCQKSPFYQQLNAIEEQNMFADERIGHEA